jgi:hypothetical protein
LKVKRDKNIALLLKVSLSLRVSKLKILTLAGMAMGLLMGEVEKPHKK